MDMGRVMCVCTDHTFRLCMEVLRLDHGALWCRHGGCFQLEWNSIVELMDLFIHEGNDRITRRIM